MNTQDIRILAEPSLDDHFCRITVFDHALLPGEVLVCTSPEEAEGSPLLEELMALEEIEQVMVSENCITLKKKGSSSWKSLGKQIGQIIRQALRGGKLFSEKQQKLLRSFGEERFSDPELGKQVKALLDEQINPFVASHGGRIQVVDVKDGVVYVRMEGGCQGCGMASVTLRQGVEQLLKRELSDVKEVVDVTNHADGRNPYYQK